MGFADDEERYRVNAFDWKGEFSKCLFMVALM